jgi:phage tail tape-measure protein
VDAPIPLAIGADTADLAGASQAVLRGLAQGVLSVDQANGLAGVLGALVRVREVTELEARITRLEESANGDKS